MAAGSTEGLGMTDQGQESRFAEGRRAPLLLAALGLSFAAAVADPARSQGIEVLSPASAGPGFEIIQPLASADAEGFSPIARAEITPFEVIGEPLSAARPVPDASASLAVPPEAPAPAIAPPPIARAETTPFEVIGEPPSAAQPLSDASASPAVPPEGPEPAIAPALIEPAAASVTVAAEPAPVLATAPTAEPTPAAIEAPMEAATEEPATTASPPDQEPWAKPDSIRTTADPNIMLVRPDAPLMQEATRRARASLEDFIAVASKPQNGERGFALKVAIGPSDDRENIWVMALERRTRKKVFVTVGETWSGRLANVPLKLANLREGDRVSFSRSDIRDWMYVAADGRMMGNFTACAIAAISGDASLMDAARQYGMDCGWTQRAAAE